MRQSTLALAFALSLLLVGTAPSAIALDEPALVTTVGRADGSVVRAICRQADLEAALIELPERADLRNVQTLVIAMGTTPAELESAGVSLEEELARGRRLIEQAQEAGIRILGIHVGGSALRGEVSDPLCALVANAADALIVKQAGDTDGFLQAIADGRGILLHSVDSNEEAIEIIRDFFD
jgi:hypothetical protein